MAIVAINQEVLDLFNHLLHDLYCTIPGVGFRPSEASLSIDFIDKDFCIHQDRIAKYRLCVQCWRLRPRAVLRVCLGTKLS